MYLTVSPAYGRDYTTAKAALADWHNDRDFIIEDLSNRWCGKPINRDQAVEAGYRVVIRYDRQRKVTEVKS